MKKIMTKKRKNLNMMMMMTMRKMMKRMMMRMMMRIMRLMLEQNQQLSLVSANKRVQAEKMEKKKKRSQKKVVK